MARALIRHIADEIEGEGITFRLVVLYYGGGVPNGKDSSVCAVTATAGMSRAQIKAAIRSAIVNEAAALGYPFGSNGIITFREELFQGL